MENFQKYWTIVALLIIRFATNLCFIFMHNSKERHVIFAFVVLSYVADMNVVYFYKYVLTKPLRKIAVDRCFEDGRNNSTFVVPRNKYGTKAVLT